MCTHRKNSLGESPGNSVLLYGIEIAVVESASMDRQRLIRSLRIACAAFFGVLCVLLIGLWVRCLSTSDSVQWCNGITLVNVQSRKGELGVGHWSFRNPISWQWYVEKFDDTTPRLWSPMKDKTPLSYVGVRWETLQRNINLFVIRYWSPVTLSATVAILPWLRVQFSLRTLLIATTLGRYRQLLWMIFVRRRLLGI
jgi:hypothetical protein